MAVLAVFQDEYKKKLNRPVWPSGPPQVVQAKVKKPKTKKMGQMKNVEAIIDNKLYLGKFVAPWLFSSVFLTLVFSVIAARSTRTLTERRITHILSVCNDAIPAEVPESGICHKRISIEDIEYADILIQLPAACQFIHQALTSGGTVLVHSVNGISRSAAVVVAYCEFSTFSSARC